MEYWETMSHKSIEKFRDEDILATADAMNSLPRKKLGYSTPEELIGTFLDIVYTGLIGCGSSSFGWMPAFLPYRNGETVAPYWVELRQQDNMGIIITQKYFGRPTGDIIVLANGEYAIVEKI